ncbi:hypothetical protein GcM3_209025 [Golovinomyces cichoracearum]|uniref:Uncharacterized protein n=1 Tax=Golovinomyces cichoracearum TaxID=62708 RepID=A0A420HAC1_9PEZI|nr:hypothetical protein GcM3_209025 [Golovinomyces cichoracearum]
MPEDSVSKLLQSTDSADMCSTKESALNSFSETIFSSQLSSQPMAQSKTQPLNRWLWTQFNVVPLKGRMWILKRSKRIIENREILRIRCSWKTTDSTRATSKSNMKGNLRIKHGIFSGNDQECEDKGAVEKISVASMFNHMAEIYTKQSLEQRIIRWIVMENIPFTAIESPYFRRIFEDLQGVVLPFQSRRTISRRIETDFQAQRAKLIEDLASTCRSTSLSLDVWTSKNCKIILGVIGYWLTADFEYREAVLDFKELSGVHSGDNMAV